MARFLFIRRCSLAQVIIGFSFICLTTNVFGQRVIVNSTGERIIMFPDGSWRLVEAGDSVLIKQNLQKSETIRQEHDLMEADEKPTEAELDEFYFRQWNELHFKIRDTEKKVQNEFRKSTNAHFSASEIYYNAQANKSILDPERLARIHEQYEESIQELKKAKQHQTAIRKLLDQSKKMGNLSGKKLGNSLNGLRSRFNTFMASYDQTYLPAVEEKINRDKIEKQNPVQENTGKELSIDKKIEKGTSVVSSGSPSISQTVPPQNRPREYKSEPYKCRFVIDSEDEATGRRRIELEPSLIFTHTDPDLRAYFKEKELITCEGKMSRNDEYIYLHINFKIASSHAQSNFGSLEKGSLLRLRLLDGEHVSVYNLRADKGKIDPYSGDTIFSGQYGLSKDDIKMLSSTELDSVRILWSTGYEDYDVYKVDFFINQLNCLMNR